MQEIQPSTKAQLGSLGLAYVQQNYSEQFSSLSENHEMSDSIYLCYSDLIGFNCFLH